MIKKQLGILAGSIALVASANAAIVASGGVGSDSTAILVLSSAGAGSYVIDTGISAAALAAGTGFTTDITAAAAFLGGSIDSYALFGVLGGASNVYSYAAAAYVDNGSGVVYAQSTEGNEKTAAQLSGAAILLNNYISAVSAGGGFVEGSAGDLDGQGIAASLFDVGALSASATLSSIFLQTLNAVSGLGESSTVAILAPGGAQDGAYIAPADQFNVTNAVPVPAAAWLFGSALLGLGVVRRKS